MGRPKKTVSNETAEVVEAVVDSVPVVEEILPVAKPDPVVASAPESPEAIFKREVGLSDKPNIGAPIYVQYGEYKEVIDILGRKIQTGNTLWISCFPNAMNSMTGKSLAPDIGFPTEYGGDEVRKIPEVLEKIKLARKTYFEKTFPQNPEIFQKS
jgi:hypothetical protein